jgi:hypothetical protein
MPARSRSTSARRKVLLGRAVRVIGTSDPSSNGPFLEDLSLAGRLL